MGLVNCAECRIEIEAKDIGGRIKDRPYCKKCLKGSRSGHLAIPKGGLKGGDDSPWGENAVRALEGD